MPGPTLHDAYVLPLSTINEQVIKEHKNKFLQVFPENAIHQSLKGGRGISQTERNDEEHVVAIVCSECIFGIYQAHAFTVDGIQTLSQAL